MLTDPWEGLVFFHSPHDLAGGGKEEPSTLQGDQGVRGKG